ncbi:MAG: DNA recombination protein RmuC [Phycisphaerae bacterium]|jgi:DNA recombination protein RmuC|nr:DNA recombination protein RmuC [Phycisphaerae bacterium]
MEYFVGFVAGVVFGAGLALLVGYIRSRDASRQMRQTFAALASEALDANAHRLGQQTGALLESKRDLIDQTVQTVNERLRNIGEYFQRLEADRKREFGELDSSISSLSTTTGKLHEMLASTQRRGAWGERMTEDILQLAGLVKGVNYTTQSGDQAESGRPDFTFHLPNDLKVNMDVKFPLESYKAYLDASTDETRAAGLQAMVTAVRGHVRAVAGRGYIDPKVPTVNYVIVFLSSEQIFSLVLGAEPDLMDESMQRGVVLASPMTLYAMLSVVRQAAGSANLMKTAGEVIELLQTFTREWEKYNVEMDKLGKYIDQASRQFEAVRTTRSRQLERPLDKIEQLRTARQLPED